MSNYEDALNDLYARGPRGVRLGLEPMMAACAALGHPERAFDVIHVAGTNGKGSTCVLVEAAARHAGLRTGLYTSPHLCQFSERFRLGPDRISTDTLANSIRDALLAGPALSFFEVATLAAFVAFRNQSVELVVLETGLGGRLDATNVVASPRCTAITTIGIDHTDYLGTSIEEIAFEKAGIIKPGVPVVTGILPESAQAVVTNRAASCSSRVVCVSEEDVQHEQATNTPLVGEYQHHNLAVARKISEVSHFGHAFDAGAKSASWPGRFEQIATANGEYLLDGAHNPDGASALLNAIRKARKPSFALPTKTALVFGSMDDKDWKESLAILGVLADARVYVTPGGRKAASPQTLAKLLPGECAQNVLDALSIARSRVGRDGLVVVAGSLYLVGEARAHLLGLPRDPPIGM